MKDYFNVESVEFQVDEIGNRIWVNIDGICALRVKGIKRPVVIQDFRKEGFEDNENVDDGSEADV